MKKVCVVTWYSSFNYGTQLQSTSLCKYLEENGCEVSILKNFSVKPYLFRHPSLAYAKIMNRLNEKKRLAFFNPVPYHVTDERRKRTAAYVKDNFHPVTITSMAQWSQMITDNTAFVTGSDIIWQPAMGIPSKMFLDFTCFENVTRVSYASSTGAKKLPEKYEKYYRRYLGKFKALSTREQNAADYFSSLLNRKVVKVIDPTLLHDTSFWDTYAQRALTGNLTDKKYILCYFVMEDPRYWNYVKKVQQQFPDYEIVVLPMHHSDEKEEYHVITNGTAYEFISLIKHAGLIITDSFHAGVFSFLYEKEFYVLRRARAAEDEKFHDLVERYGLRHRLVTNEETFERNTDTDYTAGKTALKADQEFAFRYLKNALEL